MSHRPGVATAFAVVLLAFAAGWPGVARAVDLPAPPDWSRAEPITVEPGRGESVSFTGAIFRIPVGTKIGAIYRTSSRKALSELRWDKPLGRTHEFDVATIDRMRAFGHAIVDPTATAFENTESRRTRFQVGVVVMRVQTDYFLKREGYGVSDQSYGIATLDFDLQLQDADSQEIVFQKRYSGYGLEQGRQPAPIVAAFVNAMDHALADPQFVAKLTRPGDSPVPVQAGATAYTTLPVAACAAETGTQLPDRIGDVTGAVVSVRAGAVTGSAIIVSPAGYVLTAAHVVGARQTVPVQLPTGIELDAQVLRVDATRDVALLQLPGRGHRCAPVRSGLPAVGADLFAVGTPLESRLASSVTRGVVSGHRVVDGVSLIQTDASVNAGNSGGPLFDADGHVRAVVSFKAVGVGVEGIAFGVPVDVVESALVLDFSP